MTSLHLINVCFESNGCAASKYVPFIIAPMLSCTTRKQQVLVCFDVPDVQQSRCCGAVCREAEINQLQNWKNTVTNMTQRLTEATQQARSSSGLEAQVRRLSDMFIYFSPRAFPCGWSVHLHPPPSCTLPT